MTSNLNQTQRNFLEWLVKIVREENFAEDNLIFVFTTSWTKLLDGNIEEEIPNNLNFQRATLEVLHKEGYLHCSYQDPNESQYTCSLTQKAYQIVDCNFRLPPAIQTNSININNSTGIQIDNSNEQKVLIDSYPVNKKEGKSKISAFFSHPAFLAFITLLGSAGSAAIINAIFTKK